MITLEVQYCAIETACENEIPLHFPFISPTCFTQIPLRGIFVKQFSHIFPVFPWCGGYLFHSLWFLFYHWGNTIHQFSYNFPPISPEIHKFSPNFPRIPTDSSWFPSFLCSFHFTSVALKMRIPHNARQRIINLREKYRLSYPAIIKNYKKKKMESTAASRPSGFFILHAC